MLEDFPNHRFFKVEKVVEKVLKQNKLQEVLYFSRISNHWRVIVGAPLSKKSFPIKLAKRVLLVGVVDSAYSHHLRFYESKIIELIESPEICGEGAVRKILFKTVQQPLKKNREQQPELDRKVIKGLSDSEHKRIDSTAGQIQDKRLQKIFSRYMGKVVSK